MCFEINSIDCFDLLSFFFRVPKRKLESTPDVSNTTTASSTTNSQSDALCSELTIEERFSILASLSTEDSVTNTNERIYPGLHENSFGSCRNRQIYLNSLHVPTIDGQSSGLDSSQLTNPDSECSDELDPDTVIINERFSALAASYGVFTVDNTTKWNNFMLNSLVDISSEESISQETQCVGVVSTDQVLCEMDVTKNAMECQEVAIGAVHKDNETNSEECAQTDNDLTKPAPKEQYLSGKELFCQNEINCQANVLSASKEQICSDVEVDNEKVGEKQAACNVPEPICLSSDEAYDSDTSGILNETMDSMK